MKRLNIKNNKYSFIYANKLFVTVLICILISNTLAIFSANASLFNSTPETQEETGFSGIFNNNDQPQSQISQEFTSSRLYAPNTGSEEPPIGGITPVSDGYLTVLLLLSGYCIFKIIRKKRVVNS